MEFRVNKYITLKLQNGETFILINNKLFRQCKTLKLNILNEDIKLLNDTGSIDELAFELEYLDFEDIPPEVEFWGHCSNLQVWYENNYNTNLLHSNLAFPLLKKLTEVGDLLAKRVFREEIVKRNESGYLPVIQFLTNCGFLNFLNKNEIETLFFDSNNKLRKSLIEALEGSNTLKTDILQILKTFIKLGDKSIKNYLNEIIYNNFSNKNAYIMEFLYEEGFLNKNEIETIILKKIEIFKKKEILKNEINKSFIYLIEGGLIPLLKEGQFSELYENPFLFKGFYKTLFIEELLDLSIVHITFNSYTEKITNITLEEIISNLFNELIIDSLKNKSLRVSFTFDDNLIANTLIKKLGNYINIEDLTEYLINLKNRSYLIVKQFVKFLGNFLVLLEKDINPYNLGDLEFSLQILWEKFNYLYKGTMRERSLEIETKIDTILKFLIRFFNFCEAFNNHLKKKIDILISISGDSSNYYYFRKLIANKMFRHITYRKEMF